MCASFKYRPIVSLLAYRVQNKCLSFFAIKQLGPTEKIHAISYDIDLVFIEKPVNGLTWFN